MEPGLSPELLYGADFHEFHGDAARRSAAVVVPVLLELFKPRSVVDVGCGTGLWLAAFQAHGVGDVIGIDGPWIPVDLRELAKDAFLERDLTKPLDIDRTFDVALCLEVAEHLPAASADQLIETLCHLAPVVIFSAAIPFQGGDGHCNERWPSYWSTLFAARHFECMGDLRPRFWTNESVMYWYRQNISCYVAADRRVMLELPEVAAWQDLHGPPDLVHPDLYLRICGERDEHKQRASWFADKYVETADEIARLRAGRDHAQRQLADERSELARVREELRQSAEDLDGARHELMKITNSRTWRLLQSLKRAFDSSR